MERMNKDEIAKWRIEIDNAEDFRDNNFGLRTLTERRKNGENIEYFETGMPFRYYLDYKLNQDNRYDLMPATINVVYPLVKNIIPTLYYKNPYITVIPKRKQDEDSATYVSSVLNYYMEDLEIKKVTQQIIFDAYVLGMGVCKIGYTTRFGTIPSENTIKEETKIKEKGKIRKGLEALGLRKPQEEEKPKQNPELNEFIKSENPFVVAINPFNFGIDPSATSIHDARFVYEKVTRLLSDVKSDSTLSNTDKLEGSYVSGADPKDVPDTQIDNFKTVDLYEVHYKTDEGINILVLAKDGTRYEALRHEKSVYEIDGFQYEVLYFNKHQHKLYPVSDIEVIKGLQDRINTTLENILDQVDKFVPKIGIDETALTAEGNLSLQNGDIGAIVKFNKNPGEAVKEITLTQLKADLVALIDKCLDIILLETGLTRAQLQGLSTAETATEAQIGQAGSNLRISDKLDNVNDFSVRQIRKLWQVVRQFVDLEEIQLITGEAGVDEATGVTKYSWLDDISTDMSKKMIQGEYRFDIEVGSTEKPDLPILRKQVETLANILMGEGVMQAFAMQGWKIELSEILKRYMGLFPDVFKNVGKILKPIQPQAPMQPQVPAQSGATPANMQAAQANPSNTADIISSIGGEKGNIPLA